jgi:hypothetical protein
MKDTGMPTSFIGVIIVFDKAFKYGNGMKV